MSIRRKIFGMAQIGFGAVVFMGSCFEILNLLFPSLLPEIQDNPLMKLHRSNQIVYWWTLLSNLVIIGIAALLVRCGVGLLRSNVAASRTSISSIKLFLAMLAGALIVSALFLLPQQVAMLHTPSRTFAILMIVSMASSIVGVGLTLSLLWFGHARLLRNQAASEVV